MSGSVRSNPHSQPYPGSAAYGVQESKAPISGATRRYSSRCFLPPTKGGYPIDTSDPIARTDQAKEEIKHVAPVLGAYFVALLEQGFQRCEAMDLIRDVQMEMLGGEDE